MTTASDEQVEPRVGDDLGDVEPEGERGEPVVGELVERPPDTPPVDSHSALERAAEAALAMPGIPGRDEFLSLAMQARILSLSALAPKFVKGDPHVAFHLAMIGRDLGISPTAAMELVDIIGSDKDREEGKLQASLSPQLLLAQVRRLGLGLIDRVVLTSARCVAAAVAPGGFIDPACRAATSAAAPEGAGLIHVEACRCRSVLGSSEFTWDDAVVANLVDVRCLPGQHYTGDRWEDSGKAKPCGCRQGWRAYPKRMLWWRAAGYCVDDYFPEAGLGLYSAEELGAVVDAEGRPIDPTTVELPEGYGPPRRTAVERGWMGDADEQKWADELSGLLEAAGVAVKERFVLWRDEYGVDPTWLFGWALGVDAVVYLAENPLASPAHAFANVKPRRRTPDDLEKRTKFVKWAADKVAGRGRPRIPDEARKLPLPEGVTVEMLAKPPNELTDDEAEALRQAMSGPDSQQVMEVLDVLASDAAQGPTPTSRPAVDPEAPIPDDAPTAIVEKAIAEVQAMKTPEVDEALRARDLTADGKVDARRQRLVRALVREATRAAAEAAQDAAAEAPQGGAEGETSEVPPIDATDAPAASQPSLEDAPRYAPGEEPF